MLSKQNAQVVHAVGRCMSECLYIENNAQSHASLQNLCSIFGLGQLFSTSVITTADSARMSIQEAGSNLSVKIASASRTIHPSRPFYLRVVHSTNLGCFDVSCGSHFR